MTATQVMEAMESQRKREIDFGETMPCLGCGRDMRLVTARSHRNEVDTSANYNGCRDVMKLPREKIILIFRCRCGLMFAKDWTNEMM